MSRAICGAATMGHTGLSVTASLSWPDDRVVQQLTGMACNQTSAIRKLEENLGIG